MTGILADTSVWVEFFRRGDSPESQALGKLSQDGLVCTNGLIRAEVLSGARSNKDYRRLKDLFSALIFLPDPPDLWDRVANARYRLARRGFQAGVADLIVAIGAATHGKALWTFDKDFQPMRRVVGFEVFSPPKH